VQAEAEAEFQRERAMVDEVVRRIQQEDALEAAARRAKQVRARARTGAHGRTCMNMFAAAQAAEPTFSECHSLSMVW
jgi:hypothetical protein